MAQRYELNEKDIDSVIRYLKLTDPENATPEKAIELLEELQAGAHMLAHDNPELLEQLNQELQQSQTGRTKQQL
jgi:tryptophanyl-tRNA synthetase